MSDLRSSIHALAQSFASGVLQTIRSSSLEEILGTNSAPKRGPGRPPSKRGPGRPRGSSSKRLARRSTKDLTAVANSIVALVKKHPKGLRGEQIRAELRIAKNEWMRPLGLALDSKKLTKKGEKRATIYFLGGGVGAARKRKGRKHFASNPEIDARPNLRRPARRRTVVGPRLHNRPKSSNGRIDEGHEAAETGPEVSFLAQLGSVGLRHQDGRNGALRDILLPDCDIKAQPLS